MTKSAPAEASEAGKPVRGPVLGGVEMHLHTPASPAIGRVVSSERCTHSAKCSSFVRHVAFDVSGADLAGRIVPGQSFGVLPPGTDDNGKPHKLRLYSLASPSGGEDGSGSIIATTVKRTIDEDWETHELFLGVASNYLCDLQVGDEVHLTGPSGKRFVLPDDPAKHDYLFIATGTGIAPFRGMMMDLVKRAPGSRVALVMGVPHASDLLYHDELSELVSRHKAWSYETAISRERQEDGSGPMYVHDRLRASAETLGPMLRNERTLVYLCGIAGMELGVLRSISRMLDPRTRNAWFEIDPEVAGDDEAWTRRMIHRQIRPSRRVFLEVYA